MSGNTFPAQFPSKFQRDPYMIPQQPGQQLVDESMYREQPQMTRNDWSQMIQQQQQQQALLVPVKQSNSIWPEKLSKQNQSGNKVGHKKGQDSDYSEEYVEGDESQADGDDVTTTEAPKKVKR